MAADSETLALAGEERAKQGIHELEISFGGKPDLLKHHNLCLKNPGHRNFIPIHKLEKSHLPKHSCSNKIIEWVRRVSGFTVKLSTDFVSPNRPPGYPLSECAGQRIMSTGSGYVTDFPATANNDKLPCPFTNCGELPGDHEVCGYITVVTAAHVVFDDAEAKNTTVEFFYDDPDDRSGVVTAKGVKVVASSVEGDFCELLCVTHDEGLHQRLDCLCKIKESKGRRICNLFRNILPALENILCVPGEDLKYLVKIRLDNPSKAVEALVVLGTFTEKVVGSALEHCKTNSLPEVIRGSKVEKHDLLTLINFELDTLKFRSQRNGTISFSLLRKILMDLRDTLTYHHSASPRMCQDIFLSMISALGQHYSTLDRLENILYICGYCRGFRSRNQLSVVNISYDTATVEVTLLRKYVYLTESRNLDVAIHQDVFLGDCAASKHGDIECKIEDTECKSADALLVHIAHPHGQSKQVTIGRQTDCFTGDGFYHQLYTAPTCPGCSGGPVWMIPASGDLSQIYGVPHSGHHGNELNTGSSWTLYPHEL